MRPSRLRPSDPRPAALAAGLWSLALHGAVAAWFLASGAGPDGSAAATAAEVPVYVTFVSEPAPEAVADEAPAPPPEEAAAQSPAEIPEETPAETGPPTQPVVAAAEVGTPAALRERPATFPAYLSNPPPAYPASERRRGREGLVVLSVRVTPEGRAGAVSVRRSSGVAAFDREALRAVRGWRFLPATRGGRPVTGTVTVPVRFVLRKAAGG